jgi:hypothetical protein
MNALQHYCWLTTDTADLHPTPAKNWPTVSKLFDSARKSVKNWIWSFMPAWGYLSQCN